MLNRILYAPYFYSYANNLHYTSNLYGGTLSNEEISPLDLLLDNDGANLLDNDAVQLADNEGS